MEKMNFCQSCGMPMGEGEELLGKNADGSKNKEYCIYCFDNGDFTEKISMTEMIEKCIPHMIADGGFSEDKAKKMMEELLPTLKRWK